MRTLTTVLCLLVLSGPVAAIQIDQSAGLAEAALKLGVRYDGKMTTGDKLETRLSPMVRRALNEWAPVATQLKLDVVVPHDADALVMGRAPAERLIEAAQWIDKTAALFDKLQTTGNGREPRAIVVALFDDAGFQSEAWPGLLDALVARMDLVAPFAERMKTDPGSFTARNASFFAQHTYDMVGDAASGDDEYRFVNEIAHKTAQYLLEARFGRQPDVVRWGLGYIAEQRLCGAVYQFNTSGFVASDDHFDWPEKTRSALASRAKSDAFSLTDTILRTDAAGTPAFGQQCAWAILDYQLAKEPQKLAGLLLQLGALDKEGDPRSRSLEYGGDGQRTHDACEASWGALKTATLVSHLKKLK